MESIKDQPSAEPKKGKSSSSSSSSSKLRYPLRSGSKSKDETSSSSSMKRERTASNVSKSVSVLDLSGKEKSAKPPRRLSIPAKSAISPLPRSIGTITPISETRTKKPTNVVGKSGTPASDVSRSTIQRKFSVLSSASYWLSQIKLSETAAKHSISLGFFKLALESGCEPMQKMRDELKSYAGRHNLVEFGESARELLRNYNISEDLDELQASVTCSKAPEEGARSSDEETQNSSVTSAKKFKPKSLISANFQASSESAKKNSSQKKVPANKSRGSATPNSGNLKSISNIGSANGKKKSQKSSKQELNKEKDAKLKNEEKMAAMDKDKNDPSPDEKMQQENKENMDAEQLEVVNSTEATN